MNEIALKNSGPPLEIADILVLENKLGINLSGDYRDFLIKSNGGVRDKGKFELNGRYGEVVEFLGINRESSADILWVRKAISDTVQVDEYIPIASHRRGKQDPHEQARREDLFLGSRARTWARQV